MSSQLDTAKAIAKIQSISGHAEGFAENMLHKADLFNSNMGYYLLCHLYNMQCTEYKDHTYYNTYQTSIFGV